MVVAPVKRDRGPGRRPGNVGSHGFGRGMTMKSAVAIALAALVASCGSGESRIQFGVQGDLEVLRPLLEITAQSGDWSMTLTGDEIGTTESPNYTREFQTPGSGTLLIKAVLKRPDEPVLAEGSIELEIREDWVWGVAVFLTNENPTEMCFGCIGHQAFAVPAGLTGEPRDSLFIVWGGNSIDNPVVY